MCIKKAVVKMAAAAAVVVAGGAVGTVWAQTSPVTATSVSSDNMSCTFTVGGVSELIVIPKNPNEDVLLETNVTAKPAALDPGTLGMVKVSTNSTAWDVVMTTHFGGRLVFEEEETDGPLECPPGQDDPFNPGTCLVPLQPGAPIPGGVKGTLVYSTNGTTSARGVIKGESGDLDTVQLEVSIGLAKAGEEIAPGNASGAGKVYAFGGPTQTSVLDPVLIGFNELSGSAMYSIPTGGGAPTETSPTGVSFAKALGSSSTYTGAAAAYQKQNSSTSGRIWSDVATSGFGAPSRKEAKTIDGTSHNVGSEYFYINVGFNQGLVPKLGANKKGTYKETFVFDLMSAF